MLGRRPRCEPTLTTSRKSFRTTISIDDGEPVNVIRNIRTALLPFHIPYSPAGHEQPLNLGKFFFHFSSHAAVNGGDIGAHYLCQLVRIFDPLPAEIL